jgi:polysaccharide deacetylase 2 family uncharacterized protein YibQ
MTKRKLGSFLMGLAALIFIAAWVSFVFFELLHINEKGQLKEFSNQKVTFTLNLNKPVSSPPTPVSKKSYISILIEDNETLEAYKIVDLLPRNISFCLSPYNKSFEDNVAMSQQKHISYLIKLPLLVTHEKHDGELDLYKGMSTNEIVTRVEKLYNKAAGSTGFYNMGENEEFLNDREGLEALVKKIYALNSVLIYGVNNKTSVLEPYGDLSFAVNSCDLNITTKDEFIALENLQKLESIAVKNGKAIGVLKANDAVLKALQKWNNEMKKENIEIVEIRDLIEGRAGTKNAR